MGVNSREEKANEEQQFLLLREGEGGKCYHYLLLKIT